MVKNKPTNCSTVFPSSLKYVRKNTWTCLFQFLVEVFIQDLYNDSVGYARDNFLCCYNLFYLFEQLFFLAFYYFLFIDVCKIIANHKINDAIFETKNSRRKYLQNFFHSHTFLHKAKADYTHRCTFLYITKMYMNNKINSYMIRIVFESKHSLL